jgi:glycosyltransferase involved in cell wall biosynthesis
LDGEASASATHDPLRILVVANLYPSLRHPSFGTFIGARVAVLRRDGQHVSVVAITDDRVHQGIGPKYLRLAVIAIAAAVAARLRRRPYQIIEAHIAFPTGLVAWPAARLGGGRLVLFCHGSDVTTLPWASRRRAALARWLFARADLVVANSRYTATVAETRLGPLRRPAVVISPGVDIPSLTDRTTTVVRDPDLIVFVGRLVPGKGTDVLIDAMGRLGARPSTAHLTVIGDGPERHALEDQAARLGAAVEFAGSIGPHEVADLMRAATVVAVPSTMPEGLGLVPLEAMAHGALVVATDRGGLAETMRDGHNGIVVPPGDVEALADGIERALTLAGTTQGQRFVGEGFATASLHERTAAVRESIDRYVELAG